MWGTSSRTNAPCSWPLGTRSARFNIEVQTGTEVTAIDRATRTVAVGQRAYYATRFLRQRGYRTQNLSGGYATYTALQAAGLAS